MDVFLFKFTQRTQGLCQMLKHASLNNLCLFVFINVTVILFASINWTYKHYYSQYSMNCNYQQSLIVEGETNNTFQLCVKRANP